MKELTEDEEKDQLIPELSLKKRVRLRNDSFNLTLLIVLYVLQGIPLGLSFGSVPYLLKSKLNYSDLALFSLSSYPYSLKLLWSPIVDSIYWKRFGRRKSWIVPLQFLLGLCLCIIGSQIDSILERETIPIVMVASVFTLMVFLCATQDIAVDGWALSLLTEENRIYASSAQTVGLNTGYFLSFTIFLAFSSPEFANTYFRSAPSPLGMITLGGYLVFWGSMFLICNAFLVLVKTDDPVEEEDSISYVYKTIWSICKLPHMQKLIGVMLIAKVGFQANEAVTGLKLIELGFKKEYLALSVLIDFPLQMIFGFYAAKWSSGALPLRPWMYGFYGRLVAALVGMAVVYSYPKEGGVTASYFAFVMVATVLASFMNTIQFVGLGCYFTKISDPAIGGTYMTLLNTVSNLGGTWPRYFILLAVDYFTDAPCSVPLPLSGLTFKCLDEKSKVLCTESGGVCSYLTDGYYLVNTACFIFGLLSLLFVIQPVINKLQNLPGSVWRVPKMNKVK